MNYALDVSLRLERILEELQSSHNSLEQYPYNRQNQISNSSRDSNIFTPPNPPFHRASVSTTYSAQTVQTEGGSIVSVPGQSPGTYGVQYIGKDGDDQAFITPFLSSNSNGSMPGTPRPGMTGSPRTISPEPPTLAGTHIEDIEERALQLAMEEGTSFISLVLTNHANSKQCSKSQDTDHGRQTRVPVELEASSY